MPQIRCPNCGTTINLKARRKIDYKIILSALRKSSKTFTDLLKITGLPRKTLSLRLSALRDSGIIIKDGGYRLSESSLSGKRGEKMFSLKSKPLKKPPLLTRKNILAVSILLLIGVSIGASVSGMIFTPEPTPPPPQPEYIGTFEMNLRIYDATDLFAWQALVHFNPSELVVVEAIEGDFFAKASTEYSTGCMYYHDFPEDPSKLLVGDSLMGIGTHGVSGTGTLATITFGYKSENYELPYLVFDNPVHEIYLLNSNIEPTTGTLMMEIES